MLEILFTSENTQGPNIDLTTAYGGVRYSELPDGVPHFTVDFELIAESKSEMAEKNIEATIRYIESIRDRKPFVSIKKIEESNPYYKLYENFKSRILELGASVSDKNLL